MLRLSRTAVRPTNSRPLPHQNLERKPQGTGNKRGPTGSPISLFQLSDLHGFGLRCFLEPRSQARRHPRQASPPSGVLQPSPPESCFDHRTEVVFSTLREEAHFPHETTTTTKTIGANQLPSKTLRPNAWHLMQSVDAQADVASVVNIERHGPSPIDNQLTN